MNSNRKEAKVIEKIVAKELKRCGFSAQDSLYKVENSAREFLQMVGQACMAEFLEDANNELHEEIGSVSEKDFYYHSYRRAVLLSTFGKVSFERRYYRYINAKERDEKGFANLDQKMGYSAGQVTPSLAELLALEGG